MCQSIFKSLLSVSIVFVILACDGGSKSRDPSPNLAEKKGFDKTLLLGEFSGDSSPACAQKMMHVSKESRALALLELGMKQLSIEEYRRCYKKEFLK
jgi:hypothetical protein